MGETVDYRQFSHKGSLPEREKNMAVYSKFEIGQTLTLMTNPVKGSRNKSRLATKFRAKVTGLTDNGFFECETLKSEHCEEGVRLRVKPGCSFAILDTADYSKCSAMATILATESDFDDEKRKLDALRKIGMVERRGMLQDMSASELENIVSIMQNSTT